MFDFAWSEIGLIATVALVLIGPKDLPVAIRAITDMIKKARRMAGEFQTHVDDMLREANLGEVRDSISQIRNFDIRSEVERAIDPDRSIRDTFSTNPLDPGPGATPQIDAAGDAAGDPAGDPAGDVALAEAPAATTGIEAEPAPEAAEPAWPDAPAFVPPGLVPPSPVPPLAARPSDAAAPPFIPPSSVRQASSHARAH